MRISLTLASLSLVLTLGGCDLLDLAFGDNQLDQAATCEPADPNAYVFDQAICLCGNMDKRGSGVTASSFSSHGNNAALGRVGHVSMNGSLDTIGNYRVSGALTVAGDLVETGNLRVGEDLAVGGSFAGRGHVEVGGDAWVGGDMDARGYLGVDGTLGVAGGYSHTGHVEHGSFDSAASVSVPDPCGCDPASLIDVAAEVDANQGATALGLADGTGQRELTLGTGRYYDDGTAWRGASRIRIEGKVAVYIDGDLDLHGSTQVTLASGAELDLYIGGSVHKWGSFVISHEDAPASRALRIYVAGGETMEMAGNSRFAGSIYAPQADIDFNGNLRVQGSIFANNLVGRGHLEVGYDAGITGRGEDCPGDGEPGDGTGHDPGGPGGPGGGDGDNPGCSEEHPELCPGGNVPGDGSDPSDPDGPVGNGVDDPDGDGGGDDGGDGGGGGDPSDPNNPGGTGAGGDDDPTCSEEHPELCPGGTFPGDGSGGGSDLGDPADPSFPGDDGSDPSDPNHPGGTGTGGDGSDPSDPNDPASGGGSSDPSDPSDPADGGGSSDPGTTCTEQNLADCIGG